MNEMQIFSSEQFGTIRTTDVNGEPWFCLADVCRPLGIQAKHCRERLKEDGVVLTDLVDARGRPNKMLLINEGNLYRAIFQSVKPEAEQFTDWVTEEVLPSLRKTGKYAVAHKPPEVSLTGLASLIRVTRRVMLDMGASAQDVGRMMGGVFKAWNVPLPEFFDGQISGQYSIWNQPLLTLDK